MIVKCLVENTSKRKNIKAEHGLSLYIETEEHTILFDMGQTDALISNAGEMGADLGLADIAVLSHGHYDHGGGLGYFLESNRKAPVYMSTHAFEPHYNGLDRYNGLDTGLASSPRIRFIDSDTVIGSGITLFTCTGRKNFYPADPFGLKMSENGRKVPEDFRHEIYLGIEEKGKRILISGCSHRGILNIEKWFEPDLIIGGFHFMKIDPDVKEGRNRLDIASAELLSHPTLYFTCHCTGVKQYAYLKKIFGSRLEYLSAGDTLDTEKILKN